MLRVIAGKHRGRKLHQPSLELSRPTQDRTKEAIFSMIQFKIPNSLVLDLFAGSASLAIEALSRGAMKAIAIEKENKVIDVINKNKELLDLNNLDVRKYDVVDFVKHSKGMKFDFIFMDPPYKDLKLYNETLKNISNSQLLSATGLIILETSSALNIEIPKDLVIQKTKTYGKTTILLIANNI